MCLHEGCGAMGASDSKDIELFYAGIPPSVNHYWKSRNCGKFIRHYVSKEGKEFKRNLDAIIPEGRQIRGPVSVSITLVMPDKRRRDVDNYLKATLDALQPKAIEDDCQIVKLDICKIYRKGQPGTYITIQQCEEIMESPRGIKLPNPQNHTLKGCYVV